MYRAEFKARNAYEVWSEIGTYGSESAAIDAAVRKKKAGVFLVRVIDKNDSVIYSG